MSNGQQDQPTPRYIRTIFHLGLFGLLSMLFARLPGAKSATGYALKTFLAAALPYYPAIWASRIGSRTAVIVLLAAVIAANVFLIYMEVSPGR